MYKLEIYKWLLDLFKKNPRGLTFRDISNTFYGIGNSMNMDKRTFQRCKNEIKKLFGINIECKREGDRYIYRARGLEGIDVDMLMLGNNISKLKATADNVIIKIYVAENAVEWMHNLLRGMQYEWYEYNKDKVLFEFKAPMTESMARSLLPFADSIKIVEPKALVTMIKELLNTSICKINNYSN